MHNHVLPGIDDGAPDTQTSLLLLTSLYNLGFSKVIPTPHTYTALYPNTPDTIKEAFCSLQAHIALESDSATGPLPELTVMHRNTWWMIIFLPYEPEMPRLHLEKTECL
jgi:hypothetical protein